MHLLCFNCWRIFIFLCYRIKFHKNGCFGFLFWLPLFPIGSLFHKEFGPHWVLILNLGDHLKHTHTHKTSNVFLQTFFNQKMLLQWWDKLILMCSTAVPHNFLFPVGCALAGLVLMVLVAYLVGEHCKIEEVQHNYWLSTFSGRRKSRARGYQSVWEGGRTSFLRKKPKKVKKNLPL